MPVELCSSDDDHDDDDIEGRVRTCSAAAYQKHLSAVGVGVHLERRKQCRVNTNTGDSRQPPHHLSA